MKLVIAEKKLVADAIAKSIATNIKPQKGFIQADGIIFTWCVGHLLELKEPHEYDANLKDWNIHTLPFYIENVQKKPIERTKEQFKVVQDLLKKASTVYHAGDPDDEGQLIVDELLDYVKFKGDVKRVIINDNNPKLIAKAFQTAKSNDEYRHLGYMALGRSSSDWHFGLNLTRAYTCIENKKGYSKVINIGRVQDAIKGLVVRRCREIANFKPKDFFVIESQFKTKNDELIKAKYLNIKNEKIIANLDESDRIVIEDDAKEIIQNIQRTKEQFKIIDIKDDVKKQAPPLPYNLLKLQIDMSRKYGKSMDETLAITQSLRDKYNAITYNRSDCQYLNDETFDDVPEILNTIEKNASIFSSSIKNANPSIKSKCFNSKKTSAHHAIIPTQDTFDISLLSDDEKKCYLLIARAFIAQFYEPMEYSIKTVIIHNNENDFFSVTTKTVIKNGWFSLYKNDQGNEETEDESEYSELNSPLEINESLIAENIRYNTKQTTPPSYYTEATLASELTKVAKYIKDEKLRKILQEKDKDKAGEHGGIGTPATRGEIMKNLKENGYFILDKKNILATDKAYSLYDRLPDAIRYPDLTALWHEQMKSIKNMSDVQEFVRKVMRSTTAIVTNAKNEFEKVESFKCPECQKDLKQFNGKNGLFWSCIGFKDKSCNYSCTNGNDKPTFKKQEFTQTAPKKTFKKKKTF